MSKTKPAETGHYELLFIISNQFSENELTPILEEVKNFIMENGGSIIHAENWGKKRLAYPIKNFAYGYYHLFDFDLAGVNLAKLDRSLRLMNEIIRHQVVVKKNTGAKPRPPRVETTKATEEIKPAEENKTVKTDLKDLDDKLDKILETNDLL